MSASGYFIGLVSLIVLVSRGLAPRVLEVLDGDTLVVKYLFSKYRVRLWGCDAPELRTSQPFAEDSKAMLARIALGKPVRMRPVSMDRHLSRMVAKVYVNGHCVTRSMIERGGAWWYRAYAPKEELLRHLEDIARVSKKGLWRLPDPIPPWEWRKGDKYVIGTDS